MERLGLDVSTYTTVERWLMFRASTVKSRQSVLSRFNYFLNVTKMNPDRIVEEWRNAKYDPIEKEKFVDKISGIVEDFYTHILKSNFAELSKHALMVSVRSFFKFYKIPLEINTPVLRARVTFHNRFITKQEIRRILDVSPPREKAFFLMMVETGLRPDTLVKLQYKHIKEEYEKGIIPMKIELPSQLLKDRVGDRFTFLGEDGYKALKTYLDMVGKLDDEDYIFQPEKRTKVKKPLPQTTFSNYFRKVALKLGIAEKHVKGKPYPVRLYCLRKYFRNNCRLDPAIREFFMGHSLGTDEHYISRDVEQYRKLYAENYQTLRIYEPTTPYLTPDQVKQIVLEFLKTEEGQELINQRIVEWLKKAMEGAEVVK